MTLTPEEKQKVKSMLMFLVKKKAEQSDGHNGFHPVHLLTLMEELKAEGKVKQPSQMNIKGYFLNN